MGAPPPPPGGNLPPPPPPPPQDGVPAPGGGWPAPPGAAPGAPGGTPTPGPFGPPGSYRAPYDLGLPGDDEAYAGFWARFAAYVIDAIIVGLFGVPARMALELGSTKIEECSIDRSGNIDPGGEINGLCEVPTATTWAIFGVLALIAVVAGIVYYAKLEGGSGQTVGKRALGIRVVDARTGGPIGVGRGVGRYFARIISFLVCLLGYLWMLWDPEKQTWHDKMATSHVIKV